MNGQAYIKTYALSLMADGMTSAEEALRIARERWATREANELTLDKLMEDETHA